MFKYCSIVLLAFFFSSCASDKSIKDDVPKVARGIPVHYFGKFDKNITNAVVYYDNQPLKNKLYFVKDSLFLDTIGFDFHEIIPIDLAYHQIDSKGNHQIHLCKINFIGEHRPKYRIKELMIKYDTLDVVSGNRSIEEETRIMDSLLKTMGLESR